MEVRPSPTLNYVPKHKALIEAQVRVKTKAYVEARSENQSPKMAGKQEALVDVGSRR